MQIGMCTTIPRNDEERAKLREVAVALARASYLAAEYAALTHAFGVEVEGRAASEFLMTLSEQAIRVVQNS